MTNYHLEVERKYEFLGAEELPVMIDWSVLEGLSAENPVEEHLEATYFDTNDQDLSRNLVALRRRIGGYDQGWHIKFDDRAGARHEMSFPLLTRAEKMPVQVSAFVRSVTLGDELHEIVSITTDRIRTVLKDSQGVSVAEICEDTVVSHDFSTQIDRRWKEWEVELLQAGEVEPLEIFSACETLLFAAGVEPSCSPAKIARALGKDREFEARHGNGTASENRQKDQSSQGKRRKHGSSLGKKKAPQDSLEFISQVLHMLTSNLMLWELKLRAGTPDTVHGMRIGTRQIQSVLLFALRPYARSEQKATEIEALMLSLKKLMKRLSYARDIDILADFLGSVEVHNDVVTATSREELEEFLAQDDEDAAQDVLRLLDSSEYFDLRVALVNLVKEIDQFIKVPLNTENYTNKISRRIRKYLSAYLKGESGTLWEMDPSDFAYSQNYDNALFEIRRDAQAARYCLESFELAGLKLSTDQKKLCNGAQELHEEISVLSDENVIVQWLKSASDRAQSRKKDRLTIGYLLGRSSFYAVGLRMSQHTFIPLELKRIKKLELR